MARVAWTRYRQTRVIMAPQKHTGTMVLQPRGGSNSVGYFVLAGGGASWPAQGRHVCVYLVLGTQYVSAMMLFKFQRGGAFGSFQVLAGGP